MAHPPAAATPAHITPAEQAELCRAHLPWAQAVLRRQLGPDAVDHAGAGLFEAARTYDPARNDNFQRWASRVLIWTAKRAYKQDQRGAPPAEDGPAWSLLDETSGGEIEAAVPSQADAGLIDRESMAACLKRIDALKAPARWAVLGRFLADLSNADLGHMLDRHPNTIPSIVAAAAHQDAPGDYAVSLDAITFARTPGSGRTAPEPCGPLTFRSLDDLIDAVMLFGAQLAHRSAGSHLVVLSLGRSRQRWPSLVWAVIEAERNDLRLRPVMSGGDHLVYRSGGSALLSRARERWYSHGQSRRVPADMTLDRAKLAWWCVGTLGRSTEGPVRLTIPGMTAEQAEAFGWQIQGWTGLAAEPATSKGRVMVEIPDRAGLITYLEPWAKAAAWKRG